MFYVSQFRRCFASGGANMGRKTVLLSITPTWGECTVSLKIIMKSFKRVITCIWTAIIGQKFRVIVVFNFFLFPIFFF